MRLEFASRWRRLVCHHFFMYFPQLFPPYTCLSGQLCRSRKIFFHTDAAQVTLILLRDTSHKIFSSVTVFALIVNLILQAVGKVPVDVNSMTTDLMSISGHKLYGPKGIGALYVRRRPRVRLEPIMSGGGQERWVEGGV